MIVLNKFRIISCNDILPIKAVMGVQHMQYTRLSKRFHFLYLFPTVFIMELCRGFEICTWYRFSVGQLIAINVELDPHGHCFRGISTKVNTVLYNFSSSLSTSDCHKDDQSLALCPGATINDGRVV